MRRRRSGHLFRLRAAIDSVAERRTTGAGRRLRCLGTVTACVLVGEVGFLVVCESGLGWLQVEEVVDGFAALRGGGKDRLGVGFENR